MVLVSGWVGSCLVSCVCVSSCVLVGRYYLQVVKNQAAYYHQARVEIGVLQFLNTRADPGDRHHIVRLKVRPPPAAAAAAAAAAGRGLVS